MKRILALSLTAVFLISACGEKSVEKANINTNKDTNTATPTPEIGGTLLISDEGVNSTIECNERDVEFDAETTANNITLTGECKKLLVDGVSNTVTVDKVGEIEVVGTSNKVYYGEGLDGKKPKITKNGVSAVVEKKKEIR